MPLYWCKTKLRGKIWASVPRPAESSNISCDSCHSHQHPPNFEGQTFASTSINCRQQVLGQIIKISCAVVEGHEISCMPVFRPTVARAKTLKQIGGFSIHYHNYHETTLRSDSRSEQKRTIEKPLCGVPQPHTNLASQLQDHAAEQRPDDWTNVDHRETAIKPILRSEFGLCQMMESLTMALEYERQQDHAGLMYGIDDLMTLRSSLSSPLATTIT